MQGGLDGTATTAGIVGRALEFTGGTERIWVGSPANLDNLSNKTISAWIYPRSGSGWGRILDKTQGGIQSWRLRMNDSNAIEYIHQWDGTSGIWTTDAGSVPLDQWTHVAVSYDDSDPSNDAVIYLNGVAANVTENSTPSGSPRPDNTDLTIGGRSNGTGTFNGFIDDVRIYENIKTADDVAALYEARAAGFIRYNTNERVAEYFNGRKWIAMGPSSITSTGLVGHWKLDETSGTLQDSSDYGNDGTAVGDPEYASAGVINYAMGFDGADDYINMGDIDATEPGTDDFTVAAWISVDGGDNGIIIEDRNSLGAAVLWELGVDGGTQSNCRIGSTGDGKLFVGEQNNNQGFAGQTCGETAIVDDGSWHHVAFTRNGTTRTLYVDGAVDISGSYANIADIANDGPFTINSPNSYLNAAIDDVRVYNRPLSAAEIAGLYAMGNGYNVRDGLVGWWTLDETAGTTAHASGGGIDGTMQGGLDAGTDSVSGQIGTALDFDGSDDHIDLGNPASLQLTTAFTLAAWINADVIVDNDIISKTDWPSSKGYLINVNDVDTGQNRIACLISANGSGYNVYYSDAVLLEDTWYHVGCIYDGAEGTLDIYVNGILSNMTENGAVSTIHNSTSNVVIGRRELAAGLEWDGMIDDARIYSRALSAEELQALYNWGFANGPACANPDRYGGTIIYNTSEDVIQFCNGEYWIPAGPPGDGGAGCSNPSRGRGAMIFNETENVMQYCDGANWVRIGGTGAKATTDGLVGYWKLDETSGGTIKDYGSSGNDAAWYDNVNNNVSEEAEFGQVGRALHFDGNDDYVEIADQPELNPADWTIAAWFNVDQFSGGSEGYAVIQKRDNGINMDYWMDVNEPEESFRCMYTGSSTSVLAESPSSLVTAGEWHHGACVYNSAANTLSAYYDGQLVAGPVANGGTTPPDTSAPVLFGRRDSSGGDHDMDGLIDDARIYNRALSPFEIHDLYLATGGN